MNPKNMKQYNELLWLNVPKAKRTDIRGNESTVFVDQAHICMVQLTVPSEEPTEYKHYEGEHEGALLRMPTIDTGVASSAYYPVAYLKKIIDNITSDSVRVTVQDDAPIVLEWLSDNDLWKVMVAPRIPNE